MPPDALPQLIDTLLRLPLLEPAQIQELIQSLPDPQASAQEMLRRGWITQHQFASLYPGPQEQEQPKARDTLLVGFGDDDVPPDVDGEDWDLPVGDEEEKAAVQPEVDLGQPTQTDAENRPELVEALLVPSGAASTSQQFEWDMLAPKAGGNELRARETNTDRRLRQLVGWSSKGLLMWAVFLGSFFVGRQFFGADAAARPVACMQSQEKEPKKSRVATDRRRPASPPVAAPKTDKAVDDQPPAADFPAMVFDPPLIIQGAAPPPTPAPRIFPSDQAQAQRTPPAFPSVPARLPAMPAIMPARTQTTPARSAHNSPGHGQARTASNKGLSGRSGH